MSLIKRNRKLDNDIIIKEEILSFLRETYYTFHNDQYSIYKYKDRWIVDVKYSLMVQNYDIQYLTNNLFEFGDVNGFFICRDCHNLISLKGGPKYVKGDYDCAFCYSLESLIGAAVNINGKFTCNGCKNLISLEGSPRYTSEFYCNFCDSLISLKGGPYKVGNLFMCSDCKNLISLEGSPKYVKIFKCDNCDNLKDIRMNC